MPFMFDVAHDQGMIEFDRAFREFNLIGEIT